MGLTMRLTNCIANGFSYFCPVPPMVPNVTHSQSDNPLLAQIAEANQQPTSIGAELRHFVKHIQNDPYYFQSLHERYPDINDIAFACLIKKWSRSKVQFERNPPQPQPLSKLIPPGKPMDVIHMGFDGGIDDIAALFLLLARQNSPIKDRKLELKEIVSSYGTSLVNRHLDALRRHLQLHVLMSKSALAL